ncbi:hypothetical protein, partial [Brevibacterium sp. LS14]|uniref:hypothetical protein n=1 Tax=Brevibacterium sp. LS14 TaxID=2528962 RepID=UPI00197B44C9
MTRQYPEFPGNVVVFLSSLVDARAERISRRSAVIVNAEKGRPTWVAPHHSFAGVHSREGTHLPVPHESDLPVNEKVGAPLRKGVPPPTIIAAVTYSPT